jgi:hypothetical protein
VSRPRAYRRAGIGRLVQTGDSEAGGEMMLGDLIAMLDRPGVAAAVLATLDRPTLLQIEYRAAAESMGVADFAAGAVREFVERAADDLWFQLLTIMRRPEDPGLAAVQTVLRWSVTAPHAPLQR